MSRSHSLESEAMSRPPPPPDEASFVAANVRSTVHDINNLLCVIAGQAELILDGSPDSPSDAAREILDALQTAAALCRRLLIDEEPVPGLTLDIAAVVRDGVRRHRQHGATPPELVVELTTEPDPPRCDVLRLHQAVANLVSNAQAAMPAGGRLSVRTSVERLAVATIDTLGHALPPGPYWVLAVSDTGAGISGGRLAQLFEPGYTTRADPEAHGFGLSVVIEAARWHRGGIVVASAAGLGSRFALWLPYKRG